MCDLNVLWSPLKNRIPQNFAIANFGHPVSKSWLRPCVTVGLIGYFVPLMLFIGHLH